MKKVIWLVSAIVFIAAIIIGVKSVATKTDTKTLMFEDDEMQETIKNATIQYGVREREESFKSRPFNLFI